MTEGGAASKQPRISALDGLRGVAALLVVAWHYLGAAPARYPEIGEPVPHVILAANGVQLFFLISGFVIMMSLRKGSVRAFATARFIRLYPIYWICVVLTFALVTLFPLPEVQVSVTEAVVNLTMVQSYLGVPHVDSVYWTLAIELAFYVQAGFLWRVGLLRGSRLLPTLAIWILVSAVIGRFVPPSSEDAPNLLFSGLHQSFDYIPLFVLGIAVLLIFEGRRDTKLWAVVALGLLAIVNMELVADEGWAGIPFFGIVLLVLLVSPLGTTSRPLIFLGEISYVLYLIHQNLGYVVMRWLGGLGVPQVATTLIAVVVAIGAATFLTIYVDKPLRRLLRSRLL